MLVILGIMSIAIFIEVKLYRSAIQVIRTEPDNQRSLIGLTHFAQSMRADVWSASQMSISDTGELALRTSEQRTIQWKFEDRQATRTDPSQLADLQVERFTLPFPIAARIEGAKVIISQVTTSSPRPEQVFLSQVITAEGLR
jgi:hypothetical protein